MAQKEKSIGDIEWLRIFILLVFTLAGGVFAGLVSSQYNAFQYGLFLGFLIGIAVLLTIEYAKTQIRRN